MTSFASLLILLARLIPPFATFLVSSLWQGLVLVLLTAVALRVLPNLSAKMRSALWTGVLVVIVVLPLVSFAGSPPAGGVHRGIWHAGSVLSTLLVLLWLGATIVRCGQLALSSVHLRRVLRRAQPVRLSSEPVVQREERRVRICTSPDVDRPNVAGFLEPSILLPPGLATSVSESELHQILLHEREHIRRYDQWVNLFGQISLAFFPLSPALVWVNRQLALERELACDDHVLESTGARKGYAACLARVAETSLAKRGLSLALGVLGAPRRGPELSRRVQRILGPAARPTGRLGSRLAAGSVCAVLLAGAAVLAVSPEPIVFSSMALTATAAATIQSPAWASHTAYNEKGLNHGEFTPVAERVTGQLTSAPERMVQATYETPVGARTPKLSHHRSPAVRAERRPRAVLANWSDRRSVAGRTTLWTHAATSAPQNLGSVAMNQRPEPLDQGRKLSDQRPEYFKLRPVLLQISSPDPDATPVLYQAFRTPDGLLIVMI